MALTVAVQMDPIQAIRIAGDTTFALLLEAQRRGHTLLHYTPDRLSMRDGRVTARVEPLRVQDVEGDHAQLGAQERVDLATVDEGEERQRGHRLGDRPDLAQRVLSPRHAGSRRPSPQVDDELAVVHDGERRAGVLARGEVGLEQGLERREAVVTGSVDHPGMIGRK